MQRMASMPSLLFIAYSARNCCFQGSFEGNGYLSTIFRVSMGGSSTNASDKGAVAKPTMHHDFFASNCSVLG